MNILFASGFGDIEFEVLKELALENEFQKAIKVTAVDSSKKISELKFISSQNTGPVLSERIILFEVEDNRRAIKFINEFKNVKLPPAIFAVVTEHNKIWTFKELSDQLLKEHREMALKRKEEAQNNK